MTQVNDNIQANTAIAQFQVQAVNFAYRFINDGKVRLSYIRQVEALVAEMHKNLALGVMSEKEAAYLAQKLRNEILAAARLRTSDIGLASAQKKSRKVKLWLNCWRDTLK